MKIGDHFGIGQSGSQNLKDRQSFHELLLIYAMGNAEQLNIVEAFDYLTSVNQRQSVVESFASRRQQIRSLSSQLFAQVEGLLIKDNFKHLLDYHNINPISVQENTLLKPNQIFTIQNMKREAYIQLRQKFGEYISSKYDPQQEDTIKNIKKIFEENDQKFNLEGIFNKEIDKLRVDLDQLQSKVNISTDSLISELRLANDRITSNTAILREKCNNIAQQAQFYK